MLLTSDISLLYQVLKQDKASLPTILIVVTGAWAFQKIVLTQRHISIQQYNTNLE